MNPIGGHETGVGTGAQPQFLEDKTTDPLPGTDLGTPPVEKELGLAEKGSSTDQNSDVFVALVEAERGHDIKLRTLSWQKTAVLLFAECASGRAVSGALTCYRHLLGHRRSGLVVQRPRHGWRPAHDVRHGARSIS